MMKRKPIEEKLRSLMAENLSREDILRVLYLERYPIFEITEALNMTSEDLRLLSEKLNLYMLRCPAGHRLLEDPALHASDAHYCIECKRWFNDSTLRDEIELEIRRLEEEESKRSRMGIKSGHEEMESPIVA
mgnify:CR=1 FL=1